MSSDNVHLQWGDSVSGEAFLFVCFFKHIFNFQTKEVLKVEVCFICASKNQSRFEFLTNKKAVFLCADMTRKKREKKCFLKYLVKMQKENISTQCTLYLDDDDTLAASTETKHLVEVSIFQTRRKFTTFVVCMYMQLRSFKQYLGRL